MQQRAKECRLHLCGKMGGKVGELLDVNCNEHNSERQDWFIWFKRWPL